MRGRDKYGEKEVYIKKNVASANSVQMYSTYHAITV